VLHKAVQVRLYPSVEQQIQLAQAFGCARWWWNYALNKSIETYKETGFGLSRAALNALLPALKKAEETVWLAECYSQVLQATTLNLTTAYKNFFENRAGFPKFKSKHGKQSVQYPQNVLIVDGNVKLPGNIGIVKAKIHRPIEGKVKTVTVSKTPSGKYLASILTELEGENPVISEGKIYGIDFGNAAINIRAEGIRMIKAEGIAVSAVGGEVSPILGRKSKFRHSPVITEAPTCLRHANANNRTR
jgi:putative transposase